MDYEAMSTRELQQECARRDLPSARSKAVLVQRLLDDDKASADSGGPELAVPAPADAAEPGVFRMDFPAEPGGPDEEIHLAHRQATRQAAVDAGLVPRGDAHLTASNGGRWTYEVLVRRPE